jgi:predicted DNA-binding transcriptional regulator YafY
VRGLLMRAVESGEHLEMIYMSNKSEITQRVIKVDTLKGDSLRAFCFTRHRVRTFKISNILSIAPLKQRYKEGA